MLAPGRLARPQRFHRFCLCNDCPPCNHLIGMGDFLAAQPDAVGSPACPPRQTESSMTRRVKPWLVLPVAAAIAVGVAPASASAAPHVPVGAGAASPELSTTSRLPDRREVVGRDSGLLHRLRGRSVLRQRLAHHRGDGWCMDAAVEACRRGVVRARRPVGRAGDEVLEWLGLHPLRPAEHGGPAGGAHGLRPGRAARSAVRPHDHQPRCGPNHEAVGRRALRADGAVPVGVRRRHAQRQRQPPRHGQLRRPGPRLHRRRRAARSSGAPLRRAGRHLAEAGHRA